MARPKEFDREQALQQAMEVFWSRGYEAASIRDLVARMGINRQSLYDTFGDKHALYLQALDRYQEVETRKVFELLAGTPVKKALRQLFATVIKESPCEQQRRGCFMGNAMSELAGRCAATAARTSSNMAALEGAFYQALVRGKKKGELTGVRDSHAVARFLCISLQGLMLMVKASHDPRGLSEVVKIILSVVE
jgi:TetR/AcrR family transcriptional regulator, transcriptional repressor for nem operon